MDNIAINNRNQIKLSQDRTPLQKVGAFLKEARQSRSLSIEELANELRIGQEQLLALENGQEDLLPEKVFIKAMVRRISEKLDIDLNFILEELNGREISKSNIYISSKQSPRQSKISVPIPIMVLMSGFLGIGASILLINFMTFEQNKPIDSSFEKTSNISK